MGETGSKSLNGTLHSLKWWKWKIGSRLDLLDDHVSLQAGGFHFHLNDSEIESFMPAIRGRCSGSACEQRQHNF